METYLWLHGNLVADPVLRTTANGASVANFRVASSGRRFDRASNEFRDTEPTFMSVSCWRGMAGNVMATLRKGDGVVVIGRLVYRSYDDRQGTRRSVHEVDAVAVGPDLSRYAADVRRPQRPSEPPATDPAAPAPREPERSAERDGELAPVGDAAAA